MKSKEYNGLAILLLIAIIIGVFGAAIDTIYKNNRKANVLECPRPKICEVNDGRSINSSRSWTNVGSNSREEYQDE